MERTLDINLLREALGSPQPDVLPSPEELISLIAEIEVAAIMNRFDIDDRIVRTAWYLHGVCASPQAADLYSPSRQRQAFAVSAHIFDLALNTRNRSPESLLSLAFAAQIGYRRAGQEPNATAVFRRVSHLCHGPASADYRDGHPDPEIIVQEHIETLALEAGAVFLGLQTAVVRTMVRHWRRQLSELAYQLESDDLNGTLFGPAAAVIDAVAAMTNFLTFGAQRQLDRARALLLTVLNGEAGEGDLNARWVAAHLLDLGDELARASIYSVLPFDTPRAVAQAFTLTDPPVLTLWEPQRDLLTRPAANPLDPATSRLLISVPTSAGKSLVAQMIMCTHLATVPGRVIYVSPLRSLSREMRRSLSERLRILDRELGSDVPDIDIGITVPGLHSDDVDIDVVTPERFMHALRHDPQNALNDVTLIVVDEAHHISQGQRGFLLEGLLAFCQTHPARPRIVLLSAAIGNGALLASWLDEDSPEVLFSSNWRGPRRLHGLLTTNALWGKRTTTRRKSRDRPLTTRVPLSVRISIRPAEAVRIAELTTDENRPLGEIVFGQRDPEDWSYRDSGKSTAAYKMFAEAATYFLPAGPMLVVTSTHRLAQDTARAMADHLEMYEPAHRLAEQFSAQLGEEHPLVRCTRHGIAFHHAALPTDVLEAIEDALRKDCLRAVVSTSTLTDGVNLPVRTVVITAALSNDQGSRPGGVPGLDAAKLLNAVGRAGRAGRETEGWILLALNRKVKAEDHDVFAPTDEDLQVASVLASEEALRDLANAEQLIAESADGLLAVGQSLACDFITYVWFVLDAHDHLNVEADPLESVDKLLAMRQLSSENRDRWRRLASLTQVQYLRTAPAVRRRWAATGTSLRSAEILDRTAARVADRVVRENSIYDPFSIISPDYLSLSETLRLLDEEEALEVLLQLSERGSAWSFFDRRAGKRNGIEVELKSALRAWIDGDSIPNLARRWLPTLPADWSLEQSVANISRTFEHYLSWTVGALIRMINDRLMVANSPLLLKAETAWLIRYGVDTEQAIHLLTSGVRSRTIAHSIGRRAAGEGVELDQLRGWLAGQHIDIWRSSYHASDLEIEDLIEYVRVRRRSLLRTLLEERVLEIEVEAYSVRGECDVALISVEGSFTHPVEAIDNDGNAVARIIAEDHADIASILKSGVPVSSKLDGRRLVISLVEF
ncbi:DEAD/DEAH box helicase [Nocardia shimofusensis]|uniref:DEAD/DEAH box helicase n=1 Tax=Nocardia shimofusensis TaxID=228596 RepID=UPI000A05903A|nr:DEAD/DEAH box helicase [Nocardia shimofusensis]